MPSAESRFPLPFTYSRLVEDGVTVGESPFLIVTMFTDTYAWQAKRLRQSCIKLNLPHVLCQVPTVHNSISLRGTLELVYTKANFIHFAMMRYRRPILYLDADCEFCDHPSLIEQLLRKRWLRKGCDFAIYNWAADRRTDAFLPYTLKPRDPGNASLHEPKRFYYWAHRCNLHDPSQLLCSGAVQLYANSPAAQALLAAWHRTIAMFPGSADDHCLDFTFNNRKSELRGLRSFWLPKEYARYAWWIYVRPTINHPQLTNPSQFKPIPETPGAKQFYRERAKFLGVAPPFRRDCIIDVQQRQMYSLVEGSLTPIGGTDLEFWID